MILSYILSKVWTPSATFLKHLSISCWSFRAAMVYVQPRRQGGGGGCGGGGEGRLGEGSERYTVGVCEDGRIGEECRASVCRGLDAERLKAWHG